MNIDSKNIFTKKTHSLKTGNYKKILIAYKLLLFIGKSKSGYDTNLENIFLFFTFLQIKFFIGGVIQMFLIKQVNLGYWYTDG